MRAFHANFAYTVVVINLVAGLWGLNLVRRHAEAGRPFWYTVAAGQTVLAVQFVLGLILTETYGRPGIHMFYGFVLVIAAIIAFALRTEHSRRTLIVYSVASVFIGAVAVRTMITV